VFLFFGVVLLVGVLCALLGFGASVTRQKFAQWNAKPSMQIGATVVVCVGLIGAMFAGTLTFIFCAVILFGLGVGFVTRKK